MFSKGCKQQSQHIWVEEAMFYSALSKACIVLKLITVSIWSPLGSSGGGFIEKLTVLLCGPTLTTGNKLNFRKKNNTV